MNPKVVSYLLSVISIHTEILNPKANQRLKDLAELDLIKIQPKLTSKEVRVKSRQNAEYVPSFDKVTAEFEEVRQTRYKKRDRIINDTKDNETDLKFCTTYIVPVKFTRDSIRFGLALLNATFAPIVARVNKSKLLRSFGLITFCDFYPVLVHSDFHSCSPTYHRSPPVPAYHGVLW